MNQSTLKTSVELFLAISPEEVIDVITNKVDLNKDGLVSKEELEAMFHEMRKIDALREARREMSEVRSLVWSVVSRVSSVLSRV